MLVPDGLVESESLIWQARDGLFVVAVIGEHDLSTVVGLQSRLQPVVSGGGSVVLDLSRATFLDAAFLRLVLWADRTLRSRGGRSVLVIQAASAVRKVFELTGLLDRFDHVETLSEATALAESVARPSGRPSEAGWPRPPSVHHTPPRRPARR